MEHIYSVSQATFTSLDTQHINSKFVWDYHQFLMELPEHNREQLIWVQGQREIEGNEIANQLTGERGEIEHPFTGPDLAGK